MTMLRRLVKRLDSWVNPVSGLGHGDLDRRIHAQMARTVPLTQYALENLYTGSDTVARICDLPPREMLREPLILPSDTTGGLADALDELGVSKALEEALIWNRLYGGSAIFIGADDGEPLERPLNEDQLADITYLNVYTRHEMRVASYYDDPTKPHYESAQLYEVWPATSVMAATTAQPILDNRSEIKPGQFVHASRIIRFDAMVMPRRIRAENLGWGPGIIDRIHRVIRDFDASYEGMALLLTEFVQNVYKLTDLASKSDSDDDDFNYVLQRLAQLDLARSMARAVPLDAEHESFERISPTGIQGLAELVDRMDRRLAMAADMPVQLLSGEAAGGLNAGGAADAMTENFYNSIRGGQRKHVRPAYGRLLPLFAKARRLKVTRSGRVPFDFRPLWQPSDLEISKAHEHQANADLAMVTAGVLKTHEVAKSRFAGGKFSFDTTLDETIADDARVAPTPPAAPTKPGEKTSPAAGAGSASAVSKPAG